MPGNFIPQDREAIVSEWTLRFCPTGGGGERIAGEEDVCFREILAEEVEFPLREETRAKRVTPVWPQPARARRSAAVRGSYVPRHKASSVTSSRQSPEQCSVLLELLYGRVFSLKTE